MWVEEDVDGVGGNDGRQHDAQTISSTVKPKSLNNQSRGLMGLAQTQEKVAAASP